MKYYIWVLGCAMNNSDAERIASVLELLGYEKTTKESEADLIITVACSVRQHAIDRIYGSAEKWNALKAKNYKLKTILTGCVLKDDLLRMRKVFDIIFEVDNFGKLPEYIENLKLNNLELNENLKLKIVNYDEYLQIDPQYESSFRAYVPIMTGCNNFCSYCAVPFTRGREKSRRIEEVESEVRGLVKNGFKEITLLGQNVNSYGSTFDKGPTFVNLLEELDRIKGDWRGYFYSNHPKDISDDLIALMPELKHFPAYIHLPLQSGSDTILKKMNRHYTQKQYLDLVKKIRKSLPNVALTTDIIVGYPGESGSDFAETVKVAKEAKYEMIFLAQYSPRPGTVSAKIPDDVLKTVKIAREKELTKILAANLSEVNQKMVGTIEKVLVDGKKANRYYGRTEAYKVVEIKTDQPLKIGQFIEAKIQSSSPWKLIGSVDF